MATAYTEWIEPWLPQDPIVNMLLAVGAVVLVAFLVALSFETPRRLRLGLAAALALIHVGFVARYAAAYSLRVSIMPLLDVFTDPKGRVSAVLDFTQLMLIYIAVSEALHRRRHITPSPNGGSSPTEPRPGAN